MSIRPTSTFSGRVHMTSQGSTGFMGFIEEDAFDFPEKVIHLNGVIEYLVKHTRHCAFGPAVILPNGKEGWSIKGIELNEEEVSTIKSILADIKLAPLYLSDHLYKYTAKHVLKLPPVKY